MSRFFYSLFGQVIIALLLGIATGVIWPDFAIELKPLGDAFIKLIRMSMAPLIFGVVVQGIVGSGDLRKIGTVGVKALVYFEANTVIALVFGLAAAYLCGPGHGMNIDVAALDQKELSMYTAHISQITGPVDFLLNCIPSTVTAAFAEGNILQVLLFGLFFGVGLSLVGERGQLLVRAIHIMTDVLFKIIACIVRLAPVGVFGAIAFTVGKYGIASLEQLGYLVFVFYFTLAVFIVGVLGLILRLAGFSLLRFVAYLREELLIVLATASSDSVLPQTMRKLERLGIKNTTVGLVIPAGYSFNLDAFSIYLTLVAVFIAQATNTPVTFTQLMVMLAVALMTSKGAHGVPGAAIVALAATLSALPVIPVIGLVLVLSVDWFMGMARAAGNLIGNCVATVVIAVWEGDIDFAQAHRVLNGEESRAVEKTA